MVKDFNIIILKITFNYLKKYLISKNIIIFILLHNIPGLFFIKIGLKMSIRKLQFVLFLMPPIIYHLQLILDPFLWRDRRNYIKKLPLLLIYPFVILHVLNQMNMKQIRRKILYISLKFCNITTKASLFFVYL